MCPRMQKVLLWSFQVSYGGTFYSNTHGHYDDPYQFIFLNNIHNDNSCPSDDVVLETENERDKDGDSRMDDKESVHAKSRSI